MTSLLRQSLLEVKAHAKVLSEDEMLALRSTHAPMKANVHRRTHLITDHEPKNKNLPVYATKPMPQSMIQKAQPYLQVIQSAAAQDEAKAAKLLAKKNELKVELRHADKMIRILYQMLSPSQKVTAGKELIKAKVAGKTVTRDDERKAALLKSVE